MQLRRIFRSGVSQILSGSLIGQGVLLAVSPVLTRLYSASDFGALAAFTALATVCGGLATLSWDRAIVIPRSSTSARALVALGLVSGVLVSVLVAFLTWILRFWIDDLLGTTIFAVFWWLLPVTILSMVLYAVMSAHLVRERAYGRLALRNAIQGVAQAFSSVLFGLVNIGVFGLLSSIVVGRTLSVIGVGVRRRGRESLPSLARIRVIARRYRRFPLVSTWSRTLNSLGLQLPPLVIIAVYGSLEAGLYALTIRVLATPIGIVVDAVSQYFEGTFASMVRSRERHLSALLVRMVAILLVVAILPTLAVLFLGPTLFGWVFGTEWTAAGVFAQITVVYYLAQFVVAPVSRALLVLEKQFTQLAWDITRMITTCLAVLIPGLVGLSLSDALVWLTVAQVALYAALFALCLLAARGREKTFAPTALLRG